MSNPEGWNRNRVAVATRKACSLPTLLIVSICTVSICRVREAVRQTTGTVWRSVSCLALRAVCAMLCFAQKHSPKLPCALAGGARVVSDALSDALRATKSKSTSSVETVQFPHSAHGSRGSVLSCLSAQMRQRPVLAVAGHAQKWRNQALPFADTHRRMFWFPLSAQVHHITGGCDIS